ncbi:MAG TPA: MipA/OmpV family protein [Xanthobacteraceae bacterium]|nr:MipA/OmpV family protein [Xanthobacteraceae bacterium]
MIEPYVQPAPGTDRQWTLTVGGYLMATPEFAGSSDYEAAVRPLIYITRADKLSRFRSFNDNASLALYDNGIFEAGVVGKIDWERESGDYSALHGLDDIDYAFEVGGYAQWFPADWMRLRGEVRYGFGGFEGVVADFAADAIANINLWDRMIFSAGPRMTVASSGYVDTYFGITEAESLRTIAYDNFLPAYEAGGGIYSVGVGGQILKNFNNGFSGSLYVEYKYLVGDAADSPIVVQNGDRNQVTAGVSLAYTFFLGIQ